MPQTKLGMRGNSITKRCTWVDSSDLCLRGLWTGEVNGFTRAFLGGVVRPIGEAGVATGV